MSIALGSAFVLRLYPFNLKIADVPIVHFGNSFSAVENKRKWNAKESFTPTYISNGVRGKDPTQYTYRYDWWDDGITVQYSNRRVNDIDYGFNDSLPVEEANWLLSKIMSKDAKFIGTYTFDGSPYRYYHSDQLAAMFPKSKGDFSVYYDQFDTRKGRVNKQIVTEIALFFGRY